MPSTVGVAFVKECSGAGCGVLYLNAYLPSDARKRGHLLRRRGVIVASAWRRFAKNSGTSKQGSACMSGRFLLSYYAVLGVKVPG